MTDLDTPLTKEPGALKDAHEAELGAAGPPLFDVHAYVEEFRSIDRAGLSPGCRRRGVAGRCRPGAQRHPARHRGGARLQSPRPEAAAS